MTCGSCGAALLPEARFCGSCGRPVIVASPAAATSATTAVPANPAASDSQPPATPPTIPPIAPADIPATSYQPAAVPQQTGSASGPIIQDRPKSYLPYIIAAVVLLAFGVFGWLLWQRSMGEHLKQSKVDTACYAFELPKKLFSNGNGTLCSSISDSFDTSVTVELLPHTVTADTLGAFAAADFKAQNPTAKGSAPQQVMFAGQPAYRIDWESNGMPSAQYYVYDEQSKVGSDGRKHHAYEVGFGSRENLSALINAVEQSWRWNGHDEAAGSLSGLVRTTDGATDCYSFTAPEAARVYRRYQCEARVAYGEYLGSELDAKNLLGSDKTLLQHINDWKRLESDRINVVSETTVQVGGLDARKIIYSYKEYPDLGNLLIIFVDTGNRYRSVERATGFEITGNYDETQGEVQAVDAMLASWQWKQL